MSVLTISADIAKLYQNNPNLKKSDIEQLQDWMKKQPHLPEATEEQLIWILHSCYYRMELAKTTIDNYFTIRTISPEFFHVRSVEHLRQITSFLFCTILPERTPEGYSILYFNILDSNSANFDFTDLCHLFTSNKLLHLHQSGPVNGLVCVCDVANFGFGHIIKCPPMLMKKIFSYLQDASPVRIKQIHYINMNVYVDKVFTLVKPFLKKELLDVIFFHKTVDSLWKHIPQEIIDFKNYDGKLPTLTEKVFKNLNDNRELLKFWEQQEVDESKRPEKAQFTNSMFGIEGAFKKLEVD